MVEIKANSRCKALQLVYRLANNGVLRDPSFPSSETQHYGLVNKKFFELFQEETLECPAIKISSKDTPENGVLTQTP